jgi:hypothetical protein
VGVGITVSAAFFLLAAFLVYLLPETKDTQLA